MQSSNPQSEQNNYLAWIIERLGVLAIVFNYQITPERQMIYAQQLSDVPKESLIAAFDYLSRNSEFFPTIAKIRQSCGMDSGQVGSAEARLAWEQLEAFVRKYVDCDVEGRFGPEHGSYDNYPKLSDRILDTVHRTGGWRVYKRLTDDDFPFQQKRFFEEYAAWTIERQIPTDRLLTTNPLKQLGGEVVKRARLNYPKPVPHTIKPIPHPMTDAEMRDRREMLRQQAEAIKKRQTGGDAA